MRMGTPDVWRVEVDAPAEAAEAFEAVLERFADAVSWFMEDTSGVSDGEGAWCLQAVSRTPPDRVAIAAALAVTAAALGLEPPEPRISKLPDTDWVAETQRQFPPIAAGRFFVHGSHYRAPPPAGRMALEVDAGTAFGSGEHATTWGCLVALDRLARRRRFRRPLDLGCGSGILAMAMARMWPVAVDAADIDPEAVRVARFNAQRNGVGGRVHAFTSDGWRNPRLRRRRPYDIVTANILARPLARMAPQLARHLAPGGYAVLSGLLARHERLVLNAHRAQRLSLVRRVAVDGWHTLVLKR